MSNKHRKAFNEGIPGFVVTNKLGTPIMATLSDSERQARMYACDFYIVPRRKWKLLYQRGCRVEPCIVRRGS